MVLLQVDQVRIAVPELERDAPRTVYGHAIALRIRGLERMRAEAGQLGEVAAPAKPTSLKPVCIKSKPEVAICRAAQAADADTSLTLLQARLIKVPSPTPPRFYCGI